MGLIAKLSRKLSGTHSETGVRSNSSKTSSSTDRNGLQQMNSRDPMRSEVSQSNSAEYGRPQYSTQPSTNGSDKENVSIPSQLCDVVVHCATVLPRTNTNTSSIHTVDAQQNGQNYGMNGNDGGNNNNGSFNGNSRRDTIMPMPSDNAGRLYKPPSVASSLHSSRPGTGFGQGPDMFHTPPCGQPHMNGGGQDYNNHNMNVGYSHPGAFNNNQQNGWNQSGPPTDSSQGRQRNTYRMESGAYDAGYRDAMAQLQRSLG